MEIEVGSGRLHLSYRAESFIHRCRHSRRFVPLVFRFVLCYPERIMKKIIIGLAAAALMFGVLASPISARAFSVADSTLIQSLLRTLIDLQNQLINLLTRQNPPNPPADPTAGWQTYRSNRYNFEINYPVGSKVQDGIEINGGHMVAISLSEGSLQILARTAEYKNGVLVPVSSCVPNEGLLGNKQVGNINFVVRDEGRYRSTPRNQVRATAYCVIREGVQYDVVDVGHSPIFDQILATFKFTKALAGSSRLTKELILNSNGFVNGNKKTCLGKGEAPILQCDPVNTTYEYINGNRITFGDIDGDERNEAVTVITGCGASCGLSVIVFKLDEGRVLMGLIPETSVSGAAADINSIEVVGGSIVVTETDFGGTRTNSYRVRFVDGRLVVQ